MSDNGSEKSYSSSSSHSSCDAAENNDAESTNDVVDVSTRVQTTFPDRVDAGQCLERTAEVAPEDRPERLFDVAVAPKYPSTANSSGGLDKAEGCPGKCRRPVPLSKFSTSGFLPGDCEQPLGAEQYSRMARYAGWRLRLARANGRPAVVRLDAFERSRRRNEIREACMQDAAGALGKRGRRQEAHLLKSHQNVLEGNPYGPENLYSSSCLRSFRFGDGRLGIAAPDHSRAVTLSELSRNDVASGSPLHYGVRKREELVDYDLSNEHDTTVFGLAVVQDPLLIGVRHRRGFSLLDSEGDIKGNWRNADTDLCDLAASPWQDSLVSVDCAGTIRSVNYETMDLVVMWENAVEDEVGGYRWAQLVCGGDDEPAKLRLATRKTVGLFDTRRGGNTAALAMICRSVCGEPLYEVVGGIANSGGGRRSQFYCATSQGIHLLDDRSLKNPVVTWRHLFAEDMVAGIQSLEVGGVEYVATHTARGDVHLMANDWGHSSCRVLAEASSQLTRSCLKWKQPEYPVTMGDAAWVPSVGKIASTTPFESEVPFNHLMSPWIGLALVSEKQSELTLLGLNATGLLFGCDIVESEDHRSIGESVDIAEPESSDVDIFANDLESVSSKRPAKSTRGGWDLQITRESRRKEKAWIRIWSDWCLKNAYLKVPLLDSKFKNLDGMENMKRMVLRPIRKRITTEEQDAHSVAREKKRVVFPSCPDLKPIDPTLYEDTLGKRVEAIMNGENPFQGIAEGADTDSLFSCGGAAKSPSGGSGRSKSLGTGTSLSLSATGGTPRSSRSLLGPAVSELEEGRRLTMERFLTGIQEGAVTSTQDLYQDASETPLMASQQPLDQSMSQSQAATKMPPRRKSGRAKLAGF